MKKHNIILGIALPVLTTTAQAYEIDTDSCAGNEYIYDLEQNLVKYDPSLHSFVDENTPVYYAGSATIKHLLTVDSGARKNQIRIINNQSESVNLFFKPIYYSRSSGAQIAYSPESFDGIFTSSNNPKASSGASMPANSFGRIEVAGNQNVFGKAEILWDSSTCFATPPITVSVEYIFAETNRIALSVDLLNDGEPF